MNESSRQSNWQTLKYQLAARTREGRLDRYGTQGGPPPAGLCLIPAAVTDASGVAFATTSLPGVRADPHAAAMTTTDQRRFRFTPQNLRIPGAC